MRGFKQVLYAFFYILIWSGVGAGIYFWYLRPATTSCSNGTQDYNEAGTDCGGVCAKICMPDLAPLKIVGVDYLPLESDSYGSVLVEVHNSNSDYAAYAQLGVVLLDRNGSRVASRNLPVRLAAGDIALIGLPGITASGTVAKAEATISVDRWVTSSSIRKLNIAVNVLEVEEFSGKLRVSGTLINNDSATAENVELLARFYYSDGRILGTTQGVLDKVLPREPRAFSVLHPAILGLAPEKTSITATAYLAQ